MVSYFLDRWWRSEGGGVQRCFGNPGSDERAANQVVRQGSPEGPDSATNSAFADQRDGVLSTRFLRLHRHAHGYVLSGCQREIPKPKVSCANIMRWFEGRGKWVEQPQARESDCLTDVFLITDSVCWGRQSRTESGHCIREGWSWSWRGDRVCSSPSTATQTPPFPPRRVRDKI